MMGPRPVIASAAAMLLAAVLQGRVAHAMTVWGAQPDWILIVLACAATLLGGNSGAGLGLWAGLLTAALVPITFGSFLASRTLAGALGGFLHGALIQRSPFVPPLATVAVTLAAEVVYVFMAPTHHLRTWAATVGGEIVYNALLALPVSFCLRRAIGTSLPDDPFARHL